MRIRSLTFGVWLPLCAATGTIAAQTPEFGIWPDATNATARTGVNTSAGDVVIQASAGAFRGVGQAFKSGGVLGARVVGFRVMLQDQEAATTELHTFVLLRDDPNFPGQPDRSLAGVIARSGMSLTPPGFTGPVAWEFTGFFSTPVELPQDQTFYFGLGVEAAPAWPRDGLSVHQASYYPVPGLLRRHDNPRAGAPDIAWGVDRTLSRVAQEDDPRTHKMSLFTNGVTLNNGADIAAASRVGPNPNFGVAGLYPDNSGRRDGLAFRIRDFNVGAPVIVLAAPGFTSIPLGSPLIEGLLWLDWLNLVHVASATIPMTGELILQPPALSQGQLAPLVGSVAFQALVLGQRGLRASNATLTSFQ